mmetsp:Transcript_39298/g.85854  ORF Transcript_39298/g.85854 Transcript_39298/m.85854 type:complete len:87 (-) Transcript_39298:62-322(-)
MVSFIFANLAVMSGAWLWLWLWLAAGAARKACGGAPSFASICSSTTSHDWTSLSQVAVDGIHADAPPKKAKVARSIVVEGAIAMAI